MNINLTASELRQRHLMLTPYRPDGVPNGKDDAIASFLALYGDLQDHLNKGGALPDCWKPKYETAFEAQLVNVAGFNKNLGLFFTFERAEEGIADASGLSKNEKLVTVVDEKLATSYVYKDGRDPENPNVYPIPQNYLGKIIHHAIRH